MKIHPIANEYPDYPAAEFQALKASIKENGLVSPITVDENGAIIDGRHRYLACTELGLKCETVTFKGTEDEKKKRALVLNYFRRHLTLSQRNQMWLAVAEVASLPNGTNQFTGFEGPSRDGASQKLTVKEASEKSGLSETSIERGKYVVANGIPELIAAIKAGGLTEYPAWKIAKLPKKEQRALAKKGFKADPKPRKVKTAAPAEQKQPQQPVAEKPADPPPKVELTHVERIEAFELIMQNGFNELRKLEDWSTTKERRAAVNRFLKRARNMVSLFERYAAVDPEPDKTLFTADADFPEHLSTEAFMESWNSWWSDRKKRRLSVSLITKRKQIKLLAIGDAEQAAAIVSKAEENHWKGIPDRIWIPKYDQGLWCERMPVNASKELQDEIKKALEKTSGRNGHGSNGQTDRFRFIRDKVTDEDRKMTPEERRAMITKRR